MRSKWIICLLALVWVSVPTRAAEQPPSIPLWAKGAPGSEGKGGEEIVIPDAPGHTYYSIRNIHNPSITPYLPDKDKATGAAVVVCPGGGHRELAIEHEGWAVGRWLADHGVAAFVLKYRLARETNSTYQIEVEELADVQRAIRAVRSRAQEWNLNPAAIGVMGFSAGGQLAALAGTRCDNGKGDAPDPVDRVSCRPDFQALLYPGIPTDLNLTKETPPAFLVAGADDRPAISEGLPTLYLSFKKAGVPAELHIYAVTGHGFGLRSTNKPPASEWTMQFHQWLANLGFLRKYRPPVQVPDTVTLEANIPYDQHEATVLDVMSPKAATGKKRPGVIVFHGGGWIRSTKETTMNALCLPYLEQGFVVCNVEYRVAPQGTAPAAVVDALKAAKWFFDHADRYNVDTNRIVVTGASAGGHLALMVGMTPASAELGAPVKVAAIVNGYGITDVPDVLEGSHRQSWAAEWIPEQEGRVDLAKRVSPMTYVRKELPPILTVQGANDRTVPVEHGVKLTQALKEAGVDAEMITVPNAGHGFSPQQWPEVNAQIFTFLKKRGILQPEKQ